MDSTDYTYEVLRKDKAVAKAFPLLRRRNKLSFSFHQEVAPLMQDNPEIALALLDTAEAEVWKRQELRSAVKRKQRMLTTNSSLELPPTIEIIL